ncbi:FAD-dependent monooxygenase [Microbacterium fluvii]|uniref:FAD-dependent monooxygenase n=1 Tax=Microbacterium fluvii TaxID=415215 RepID=A0ABW2HAS2_9MICO|nr:FAD-dependent monooxygenase [Microbacterium fluvii]MCU4671813.1 FAD-dependent monooxygenase [Microbacterium fluvii]
MPENVDVLIVGAGAVGLTLACDLARRGVSYRLLDAASTGFAGSRAKAVQPRTQEVFDDLGVLPALEGRSILYPPLGLHLGPITLRRTMIKLHQATPDVPHANTLLAPQYATDASLRERLAQLGGTVEQGTRLVELAQDADGVTATVEQDGQERVVRARFVVGADGGSSTVRKQLAVAFRGTTDESDRMIVADVVVRGLSRDRWHIWPRKSGRFVALCPLPGDVFQLMLRLRPQDPANLSAEAIERLAREVIGNAKMRVEEVRWSSVWRPNIRLAERYRVGRVFLAGDAAHVHPPTGGQGLNTGVQDAYNLGWKLGQVIAGAPEELLDTYEAERQPVAARVLGLASDLYAHMGDRPLAAMKRGDEERQLGLSYRGGPLASSGSTDLLATGDRAPDSPVLTAAGDRTSLFDIFRGKHFTVLTIGAPFTKAAKSVAWPETGAGVRVVELDSGANEAFRRYYGLQQDAALLVRPDGYIAAIAPAPAAIADWRTLPAFPAAPIAA